MALRLIDGSEFLHIPKTGGSWVTVVLRQNGLIAEEVGHKHADFDRNLLRDSAYQRLWGQDHLRMAASMAWQKLARKSTPTQVDSVPPFRFCFVRHPLSWYESWWKFMEGRNWNHWGAQNSSKNWHINSLLNGLGSSDFNQFVQNVVRARPGYVSELLFAYTKPGISYIGKTENLRSDLRYVLDRLKLDYDVSTIEKLEKKNVSEVAQSAVTWDAGLRRDVLRLELPALIHFDYLSAEEKADLGISLDIPPHAALQREDL